MCAVVRVMGQVNGQRKDLAVVYHKLVLAQCLQAELTMFCILCKSSISQQNHRLSLLVRKPTNAAAPPMVQRLAESMVNTQIMAVGQHAMLHLSFAKSSVSKPNCPCLTPFHCCNVHYASSIFLLSRQKMTMPQQEQRLSLAVCPLHICNTSAAESVKSKIQFQADT